MKTLGQVIRDSREAKDLSLREFARKIKITAAFLSDIELGRRNPSDEVLSRISKELGLSNEELKKHDARVPLEDIKRLTDSNPLYGFAFRKAIDSNMSPEDLIKLAEEKGTKKRSKE